MSEYACIAVPEHSAVLMGPVQARRMLREADENGDGLVSREEFHDLFTRSTTPDVLQGYDSRWTAPEPSNGAVAA